MPIKAQLYHLLLLLGACETVKSMPVYKHQVLHARGDVGYNKDHMDF